MELSCSEEFARFALFVVNFFIWASGAALLGIGIWMRVDPNALSMLDVAGLDTNLSKGLVDAATYMLIIVGAFLFIVGFLACCGAMKKSACLLRLYSYIVLVLLLIQVVGGILAAVYKDKLGATLSTAMMEFVQNNYDNSSPISASWDLMQKQFSCCGGSAPRDFDASQFQKKFNTTIGPCPVSCCVLQDVNANPPVPVNITLCHDAYLDSDMPNRESFLHVKGCYPALYAWINQNLIIIMAIAFGLVIVQILAVVFACVLVRTLTSK